jgi:aspartyl-tRNA(Asn)/glutamyl-tRNA(Gln) amidotransferase subunit B
MARSGQSARQIVEEKGLAQISDSGAIEDVVARILAANPAEVEAYQNGKAKLLGFFVGQVMRETRGQANPQLVNDILKRKLEK